VACQCAHGVKIQADDFLFRQAIQNLLQNAMDFTPPHGKIGVIVSENSEAIQIQINDTGCGIPEYALGRVIEKFYSLERPATGKKSSGLGLSFVSEIMRSHQGTLHIANRPEGGVSVRLKFLRQ